MKRESKRFRLSGACPGLCLAVFSGLSWATAPIQLAAAYVDMSLEDLASIEVTSVSKKSERLSDAAAAIFVITSEDIRRSGYTTLPEVLRLAPNLNVAQVHSGSYAISARGFNNAIGNKLLVLIDGRTVYTPMFSGVNWDAQYVMLEDVERIEVISGPGGTLWGANAVNGVINVITRRAEDTQGTLLAGAAGNRGKSGSARYGGKLGADGHYRIYASGFDQGDFLRTAVGEENDGWRNGQAGFRADFGGDADTFTLQGDAYQGKAMNVLSGAGALNAFFVGRPETTYSGMNLLGRWQRRLDGGSDLSVQTYFDRTRRDDQRNFADQEDTFDIEFQHGLTLSENHRILWGGGYRYTRSEVRAHSNPGLALFFTVRPPDQNLYWTNLFIQDEISLRDGLKLTLGLKGQSSAFTATEYLPNVRLAWKPNAEQLWWGALSRTVRAPARYDRQLYEALAVNGTPIPAFTLINGGTDFKSEIADVLEIGYRAQPRADLSFSVTAFYSVYDRLRTGQPPPAQIQNMMSGKTTGIETWGNWRVNPEWQLAAGFKTIRERFHLQPGSTDPDGSTDLGNDPASTWMLRSSHKLGDRHEFDVLVRHVGALPDPPLPGYTSVDLRVGWLVSRELELALGVQNLFDSKHPEFVASPQEEIIGRSANLKATWRF